METKEDAPLGEGGRYEIGEDGIRRLVERTAPQPEGRQAPAALPDPNPADSEEI